MARSGHGSPGTVAGTRLAVGSWGTLARVGVGLLLIYLALFWRDPEWIDAALGLVAMPALALAGVLLWSRRRSEPIRATARWATR